MITDFNIFKEAVANGTEMIGFRGVGFPRTDEPKILNLTKVLLCEVDDKFYTESDYNYLYQEYLKHRGKILHGFSIRNLNKVVAFLNKKKVSY